MRRQHALRDAGGARRVHLQHDVVARRRGRRGRRRRARRATRSYSSPTTTSSGAGRQRSGELAGDVGVRRAGEQHAAARASSITARSSGGASRQLSGTATAPILLVGEEQLDELRRGAVEVGDARTLAERRSSSSACASRLERSSSSRVGERPARRGGSRRGRRGGRACSRTTSATRRSSPRFGRAPPVSRRRRRCPAADIDASDSSTECARIIRSCSSPDRSRGRDPRAAPRDRTRASGRARSSTPGRPRPRRPSSSVRARAPRRTAWRASARPIPLPRWSGSTITRTSPTWLDQPCSGTTAT